MSFAHPDARTMTQPHYPIRTERLRVRPVVEGDLAAINAYRSLPEVATYLPHPPQTMADTALTVKCC